MGGDDIDDRAGMKGRGETGRGGEGRGGRVHPHQQILDAPP